MSAERDPDLSLKRQVAVERYNLRRPEASAEIIFRTLGLGDLRLARQDYLTALDYDTYLRTPEWADIRLEALEEAGWRCRLCDGQHNLQPHHLRKGA